MPMGQVPASTAASVALESVTDESSVVLVSVATALSVGGAASLFGVDVSRDASAPPPGPGVSSVSPHAAAMMVAVAKRKRARACFISARRYTKDRRQDVPSYHRRSTFFDLPGEAEDRPI